MPRTKALIIGINYYGQSCQLSGCINDAVNVQNFLVRERGFSPEPQDMVILTDAPENEGTIAWPSMANMMSAFAWLASSNEPGDIVWLSYSGHGGQTTDPYGNRATGYDDTICPVDFDEAGQINSTTLHQAIVSPLHPGARLTILFDCCHSGSACELPYVYRPDADGNVNLVDTLKRGAQLFQEAEGFARDLGGGDGGGFSVAALVAKEGEAQALFGDAKGVFTSLRQIVVDGPDGGGGGEDDGLAEQDVQWAGENKDVWMFSGCADNQTSADTNIGGVATGAMSWAFIAAMRQLQQPTYLEQLRADSPAELRRRIRLKPAAISLIYPAMDFLIRAEQDDASDIISLSEIK
ncbi:metacaspase [Niveomyces insectorum RCEF 264]|uniref:Metacaspase n=1 Tax=Niveomyces insectorum RCEF 264 TaxID=1081102 RepID=A0A167P2W7_9HYPO|nr:metacaspase [Niveomyces insectorum RCEF 264]